MRKVLSYGDYDRLYGRCICCKCFNAIKDKDGPHAYSKEHPIPKCLFLNKQDASDFIIPSHIICNNVESNDDDRFFHLIFKMALMYRLQCDEFNNHGLTSSITLEMTRKDLTHTYGFPFGAFEKSANTRYGSSIDIDGVSSCLLKINGLDAAFIYEPDMALIERVVGKIAGGISYKNNHDKLYLGKRINNVKFDFSFYDRNFSNKNMSYHNWRISNILGLLVAKDPYLHRQGAYIPDNRIVTRLGGNLFLKDRKNTYLHTISETNIIVWFYKSIVFDIHWDWI